MQWQATRRRGIDGDRAGRTPPSAPPWHAPVAGLSGRFPGLLQAVAVPSAPPAGSKAAALNPSTQLLGSQAPLGWNRTAARRLLRTARAPQARPEQRQSDRAACKRRPPAARHEAVRPEDAWGRGRGRGRGRGCCSMGWLPLPDELLRCRRAVSHEPRPPLLARRCRPLLLLLLSCCWTCCCCCCSALLCSAPLRLPSRTHGRRAAPLRINPSAQPSRPPALDRRRPSL